MKKSKVDIFPYKRELFVGGEFTLRLIAKRGGGKICEFHFLHYFFPTKNTEDENRFLYF